MSEPDYAGIFDEYREVSVCKPDDASEIPLSQAWEAGKWPEPLADEAFHGPAGQYVRAAAPYTEADEAGVLVSLLILAGNAMGRHSFLQVGATRHYANTNLILTGASGVSRKGTAQSMALLPFKKCEALRSWTDKCVTSGLSSGEGLIFGVRDEVRGKEPVREKGRIVSYNEVVTDDGIEDKRAVYVETEFSNVLKVSSRDGNTLSGVIRQAFDDGELRLRTKNSPATATGAHISIIGHTTPEELIRYLSTTEMGNGLANRFLWVAVKKTKNLPDGECAPEHVVRPFAEAIGRAVEFAGTAREIQRDGDAKEFWRKAYAVLTAARSNLLGAILSRAEVQVLRLCLIYALLDRSPVIKTEHLGAALAVWEYCENSARFVFGGIVGDPLADTILAELRDRPEGSDRTAIAALFSRNQNAAAINQALNSLQRQGLAMKGKLVTGGRPREVWTLARLG